MIGRILVGIDGSKASKIASEYGFYLSKSLKRPVIGINIVDIRLLEGPFMADIAGGLGFTTYADFTVKIREILEERSQTILDEFTAECRQAQADCSIAQAYGIPDYEIVQMADPEDLIIVGKKGEHSEIIKSLIGSTAEKVARKSVCPVMITPMKEFKPITNILVCFDGREKSVHGLDFAKHLSEKLNTNIKVISVFEDMVKDSEKVKEFKERVKTIVEKDVEFIDKYGLAEEQIENFIKSDKDIDLVVLGAYGDSYVKEIILGSTTSYITAISPVPVILVK
ncbi:MAG: universal stress protein [Hydrogenothermaceae bacterium]